MEETLGLLGSFYAWFSSQPTTIQVVVAAGVAVALYPVLVVLRVLVAALYGTFRGLG